MENQHEKTLNYLFERLTEIYYLKDIGLTILKYWEQKTDLTPKEQALKAQLINILFNNEYL